MKIAVPRNPERDIGSDVFAWGALNKTGYRTIRFLNEHVKEYLTIGEIQAGTGLAYGTVKSRLGDLGEWLQTETRGRSTLYKLSRRIGEADLEKLALQKGTQGRRERLKRQHGRERESYRAHLRRKRESGVRKEESA